MLKQLQHKRFITMPAGRLMLNDKQLSRRCYWYAQVLGSIMPTGIENDVNKVKRPDCIHT